MSGECWVGREEVSTLAQGLLHTLLQSSGTQARQNFGLTPRELDMISAAIDGYSNKEIARYRQP